MKAGAIAEETTSTAQIRKEKTGRLQGENPTIGIRPTIDGRQGGVRESLEAQTMNMAVNLANFLSSNFSKL